MRRFVWSGLSSQRRRALYKNQFLSKHIHAALQHHCWTQWTNWNINGSSKWDKDDREAAQVWKCVLYNLSDKANAVRSCLNNLSYLQPPILWLAAWLLHTQSTDQQLLSMSLPTPTHTHLPPHRHTFDVRVNAKHQKHKWAFSATLSWWLHAEWWSNTRFIETESSRLLVLVNYYVNIHLSVSEPQNQNTKTI